MRLTRIFFLTLACVALAAGSAGCDGDDDDNGTGGTGGTGAVGGTGGDGGGGAGGTGGGGAGGGGTTLDFESTVATNPLAAGAGVDLTTLEGLTVRLVDPAKSLAGDPNAVLATETTDATGAFSFSDVDISEITLGVVVTVDDADGGADDIATSTMAVCQPTFDSEGNVDGCPIPPGLQAFAVPTAFNTALETAQAADLLTDGYVLGLVADSSFAPLSGVQVAATGGADVDYLATDLTDATGDTTTETGAFISQPPAIAQYTPTLAGTTFTPASQSAGTSDGVVFQVFFVGAAD